MPTARVRPSGLNTTAAGDRPGSETYNIGTTEFGTMRETLQALVDHAGTGSQVRSLPSAPASLGMQVASRLGQAPFAPYHWLLYGHSLWFDTTKAQEELAARLRSTVR